MSREENKELKTAENRGMTPARRRRINRLKKIIVWTVLCMILLPLSGCIILGIKLYQTNQTVNRMAEQIVLLQQNLQESADEADRTAALLKINEEILRNAENVQTAESLSEAEDLSGNDVGEESENRKIYLTFDDGPSIYTGELLDILAECDVKATFFVTGKGKENYGDIYRRIAEEGHTLGMHSYSHVYADIYASPENFEEDLETLQDFLYEETGHRSLFYRFPGGSSNRVSGTDIKDLAACLEARDITYFDWNISAGDAVNGYVSSDEIVSRVMCQIPNHQVGVVLMHDAADKHSTVEALPKLIEAIRAMEDGTEILPITEETMPIQHVAAD